MSQLIIFQKKKWRTTVSAVVGVSMRAPRITIAVTNVSHVRIKATNKRIA